MNDARGAGPRTTDGGLPAQGSPPLALPLLLAATGPQDVGADLLAGGGVPLRLRGRAPRAPRPELLDDRLVHGPGGPRVEPRQLPCDPAGPVPDDHPAHGADGDRSHRHLHAPRVPVRLLHGQDRRAPPADRAPRRDRAAALGQLPGARLLVAPDPQPGRGAQLLPEPPQPARPEHRLHELGHVARVHVHLVPVHGASGVRGSRAGSVLPPRGVRRSRRPRLHDASPRDPAARGARARRGVDLHVLAHARRLHRAVARRRAGVVAHRDCRVREPGSREQRALRGRLRDGAARDHGGVPRADEATRGVREHLMETRTTKAGLWVSASLIFLFLWIPLAIMALYAFNSSNIQSWPIPGFTTKWFHEAWNDEELRNALWLSLRAGLLATAVALVLGSLAAFGLARAKFFGRDSISFLFILPIALPGIITGLALNSFFVIWGVDFSLWTIVIGHATFCVVIVYNNVIARLRRTSGSFFEASADLGATGFQTFRYVTLPVIGTALVAGGLLAFALSWDEIVVTYFTAGAQNTLPLLLYGFIRQGQNLPIVNAIALVVIVVSVIPVLIAQRLTSDPGAGRG